MSLQHTDQTSSLVQMFFIVLFSSPARSSEVIFTWNKVVTVTSELHVV